MPTLRLGGKGSQQGHVRTCRSSCEQHHDHDIITMMSQRRRSRENTSRRVYPGALRIRRTRTRSRASAAARTQRASKETSRPENRSLSCRRLFCGTCPVSGCEKPRTKAAKPMAATSIKETLNCRRALSRRTTGECWFNLVVKFIGE